MAAGVAGVAIMLLPGSPMPTLRGAGTTTTGGLPPAAAFAGAEAGGCGLLLLPAAAAGCPDGGRAPEDEVRVTAACWPVVVAGVFAAGGAVLGCAMRTIPSYSAMAKGRGGSPLAAGGPL